MYVTVIYITVVMEKVGNVARDLGPQTRWEISPQWCVPHTFGTQNQCILQLWTILGAGNRIISRSFVGMMQTYRSFAIQYTLRKQFFRIKICITFPKFT